MNLGREGAALGKPGGMPSLEVDTDTVDLSWGFTDRLDVDVAGATNSLTGDVILWSC